MNRQQRYYYNKLHGRCAWCGQEPGEGKVFCTDCLRKKHEIYLRGREKKAKEKPEEKKRSICIICYKEIVSPGEKYCTKCKLKLKFPEKKK